MGKSVLNFFAKFALFCVLMLLVAEAVPYDDVINSYILNTFDYDKAEKVTRFILGEPDMEPWESLHDYLSVFINTLISIPLLSLVMTALNVITDRGSFFSHAREFVGSILRRMVKVFGFMLLFWAVFRLLPYESVLKDASGDAVCVMVIIFNLIVTITVYITTIKSINKIRS